LPVIKVMNALSALIASTPAVLQLDIPLLRAVQVGQGALSR
jgi:hypothetical protein